MAMPNATLVFHSKRIFDDGTIVEAKIWAVPSPVRGSTHALKYSLFYGSRGRRLIGYDNEPGQGDHRHLGDIEEAYVFISVEQLVEDFLSDINQLQGE